MPDQPEERDDEDSAEIRSSLIHEIEREPRGGSLLATITERRGLRRIRWIQFDEANVEDPIAFDPAGTHAVLFTAANGHLRAVGEMDYFAVLDTCERLSKADYPSPEQMSTHLKMWVSGLMARKGTLAIDTVAARFLQSQDRLFLLLNENKEMQEAAMAYADAWHWLHMELYGEHELAANAEAAERSAAKASAGRAEGPKAQKKNGALRRAIIEAEYKKYAENKSNVRQRQSAKHAASQLLETINKALASAGLGSIQVATLEKRLTAIIKDAQTLR